MGGQSQLVFRKATMDDLDDITTVAQEAFPDDPEWNYRFPYRDKYPEDNRKYTMIEYKEYIDQPEKYGVFVVTTPRVGYDKTEGAAKTPDRPIAIGVWDIAVMTPQKGRGLHGGMDKRRDANKAHMKMFAETLDKSFAKHFAPYGKNQIHLWLLATHPDFRRRGAGTMICNWGQDLAAEKGWPVTVLASPMGKALYEELEYRLAGSAVVQIDGEEEKLTSYALVLGAK